MGNKRRVAVMMGGISSEREVSIKSGTAVLEALRRSGHDAFPVDIRSDSGSELEGLSCDVAFLALHGRFGEDGTLQKMLESRGIPYTGSDAVSSAAAMDKLETKRRFKFFGVDTPPHRVISRGDSPDLLEQFARSIGYPVVLKPASEGSSMGISVHEDFGTILEGASEVFRYGPIGLMEKCIQGRELTVGILSGRALPIVEIRSRKSFFDFDAKYVDGGTTYLVRPPLSDLDQRRISKAALEAFHALHCDGFGRVDIIFSRLHSVSVLEVNTIPGMTPRSLLPKAAAAQGVEFPRLCETIVELALKRRQRRSWSAAML